MGRDGGVPPVTGRALGWLLGAGALAVASAALLGFAMSPRGTSAADGVAVPAGVRVPAPAPTPRPSATAAPAMRPVATPGAEAKAPPPPTVATPAAPARTEAMEPPAPVPSRATVPAAVAPVVTASAPASPKPEPAPRLLVAPPPVASTPPRGTPPPGTAGGDTPAGAPRGRPSGYSVQVGAFGERANAESLVAQLERLGIPAFVIPTRTVFKVWAGDEPDRARAQDIAERVKAELGLDGWVVR